MSKELFTWALGQVAGPLASAVFGNVVASDAAQQAIGVVKTGAAHATEKLLAEVGEVIERKEWRGPDGAGIDIQDAHVTLRHTTVKRGSLAFAYTSSALDITGAEFKNVHLAGTILMMAYTCEWGKGRIFSPQTTRELVKPNETQSYHLRPIISFADAVLWLKSASQAAAQGQAGAAGLAKWSVSVHFEGNPLYFLGRIIASGRYLQGQEIAGYAAAQLTSEITAFNDVSARLLQKVPELVPYADPLKLDASLKVVQHEVANIIEEYKPKTYQEKLKDAEARAEKAESELAKRDALLQKGPKPLGENRGGAASIGQ